MKHQTVREAIAWLETIPPYYTVETIVVHVEPEPTLPKTEHEQQLDLFGWPDHLPAPGYYDPYAPPRRKQASQMAWDDPRLWQPGTYQNGA